MRGAGTADDGPDLAGVLRRRDEQRYVVDGEDAELRREWRGGCWAIGAGGGACGVGWWRNRSGTEAVEREEPQAAGFANAFGGAGEGDRSRCADDVEDGDAAAAVSGAIRAIGVALSATDRLTSCTAESMRAGAAINTLSWRRSG